MMMKKGQSCSIIKQHFVMIVVLIVMLFFAGSNAYGTAFTDLVEQTAGADDDEFLTYDLSATSNKRMTFDNFWDNYLYDKLAEGLPDGSVGTPALGFALDTDTGIYRVGTNNFGLTTAGVGRIGIDTATIYPLVDGGMDLGKSAFHFGVGYFDELRADDPDSDDDVGDRAYNDARYIRLVETKTFTSTSATTFTLPAATGIYKIVYNLTWTAGTPANYMVVYLRFNAETDATYVTSFLQNTDGGATLGQTLDSTSIILSGPEETGTYIFGEAQFAAYDNLTTHVTMHGTSTSVKNNYGLGLYTVGGSKALSAALSSATFFIGSGATGATGKVSLYLMPQ